MIYGVNFGGPAIPTTPRTAFRKFKARIRVPDNCTCRPDGIDRGGPLCRRGGNGPALFMLVGIAQSEAERDRMLIVGNNGTRRLHVEARTTAAGTWFGIYAG